MGQEHHRRGHDGARAKGVTWEADGETASVRAITLYGGGALGRVRVLLQASDKGGMKGQKKKAEWKQRGEDPPEKNALHRADAKEGFCGRGKTKKTGEKKATPRPGIELTATKGNKKTKKARKKRNCKHNNESEAYGGGGRDSQNWEKGQA